MSVEIYSSTALRRSGWHFLSGKIVSGILTFAVLLWVVRLLPTNEYGAYITFIAANELALAIAAIGLPWMAARYLPEFRLKASKTKLVGFIVKLLVWQLAAIALLAFILFSAIDMYLNWAGLSSYKDAASAFLLLLLFEGSARSIRDNVLGPLLLQGYAQISLISKNMSYIALLALFVHIDYTPTILQIAYIEIASSILAAAIALAGLTLYLKKTTKHADPVTWIEPDIRKMWRTAIDMYLSQILTLLHSPQFILIMTQKILGNEAVAMLGFLRNIIDLISRHLPATLLFSLVRPKLISSFINGGGIDALSTNANLAGKLSLFFLAPILVFSLLAGEDVIAFASGGKFSDTGGYFFGFMLALIPFSQRQLLETVSVTAGYSSICTRAAISGPLTLLLLWAMTYSEFGLWAPIIALGMGYSLFNLFLLYEIKRKTAYQSDKSGLFKISITIAITYLFTFGLPDYLSKISTLSDSNRLFLTAAAVLLCFTAVAFAIKPFTNKERCKINHLANARIFVW
jgi:O-antigen/teichoic acid export membrane protein